jgi:8-oxo-dGTP pyrophosphatase MutT (NUDIX family)
MKFEFSAGGIVFKPENIGISVLLCQHSLNHSWGFPKGRIGDVIEKETQESTAVREVKEETGIDAKILQKLTPFQYWYVFEGEKRKKKVSYFLMKHLGGDITVHDHEMENVEWLREEDVEKRLSYPGDRKVWKEAKEIIEKSIKY